MPGGLTKVTPPLFDLLKGALDKEQPVVVRTLATDVLSRGKLTNDQLLALADLLKTVGPLEVEACSKRSCNRRMTPSVAVSWRR